VIAAAMIDVEQVSFLSGLFGAVCMVTQMSAHE
jgi:hypothetical protein